MPNLDYLHKTRSSPQKQAQSKLFRTQAAEVKQKKEGVAESPTMHKRVMLLVGLVRKRSLPIG